MSSRIEQLIDEIEEYIDNCKYQPLSNSKIIVNKDEIDDLLRELRQKTPEEIKRYQKIISNKEAILNDAREKAQALINEATEHTTERSMSMKSCSRLMRRQMRLYSLQLARHRRSWTMQRWKPMRSRILSCSILTRSSPRWRISLRMR